MKRLSNLLVLFFLTTSCNGQINVKANNSRQTKLVKTQGSNEYSAVNCGFQDRSGILWFGTSGEGVYRYDGKYFTNFTEKDGLNSNIVFSILEDKNGNLWFTTSMGLCRYEPTAVRDGKSPVFTSIPSSAMTNSSFIRFDNPASANFEVKCILQDKTGKVWLGTKNGVYLYDGKSFTHFLDNDGVVNKEGLHLTQTTDILEDKNGVIWITTWFEGICRYDGKSITSLKPNGKVWFASILEDRTGKLWFGTRSNGPYCYDPVVAQRTGKETFTSFADVPILSTTCICAMTEDKAGNIWFATEYDDLATRDSFGGVWCYHPPAMKNGSKALPASPANFTNFTVRDGLPSNEVFSILADRSGNVWFGTRNIGLCRYNGKEIIRFSK